MLVLSSFQTNGSRTSWCGIKTETKHLVLFIDFMVHNITCHLYLLKIFLRKCTTVLVLFRVFLLRFYMLRVFLHVTIYTEQKKKRNNRPPKIFEFKGKTLIIPGLWLYDSHLCDIRVYHAKNRFSFR